MKILINKKLNHTYVIIDTVIYSRDSGQVDKLYDVIRVNGTSFTDKDIKMIEVSHEDSSLYTETELSSVSLHTYELRKIIDDSVVHRMRSFHIVPKTGSKDVLDTIIEQTKTVPKRRKGGASHDEV